ncbi:DUF6438 domain-containing protein [Sphingobium yanoikuyae]
MYYSIRTAVNASALLLLAGCATGTIRPQAEPAADVGSSITIAVGPCFGFCPVYRIEVGSTGRVVFTGERHTAVIGERSRDAGAAAYRSLEADLAEYRPADGTTQRVECDAAITDTSTYTITWRRADGREAEATHQSRCSGGQGQKLDVLLQSVPERLGVSAWAKQVTRPGASRG